MPSFCGDTPLHVATSHGNLGLAALFVSMGANPDVENYEPQEEMDNNDWVDGEHLSGQVRGYTPQDLANGNEKVHSLICYT